jgi:hypothetical protein
MSLQSLSTLENIRVKVRRLTRSPSNTQITDDQINDYVNNFYLFDFPEELRTKTLDGTFTFYAQPNIEGYAQTTNPALSTVALYQFLDNYTSFGPPAYCQGRPLQWAQTLAEFTAMYPQQMVTQIFGYGDGATTNFSGTLDPANTPIISGNIVIESVDVEGRGITVVDQPTTSTSVPNAGYYNPFGNLYAPNDFNTILGTVNYLNGTFDVIMPVAPAPGAPVAAQVQPYTPGVPDTVYFDGQMFHLRPVPLTIYQIVIKAQLLPTQLLDDNDNTLVYQWWQYIAYGTAIKILQDRVDLDSVQLLMPEFKRQEHLVERSTIVQLASQRTSTIYSQTGFFAGFDGWNNSNG